MPDPGFPTDLDGFNWNEEAAPFATRDLEARDAIAIPTPYQTSFFPGLTDFISRQ
jgi:hypothetical protein